MQASYVPWWVKKPIPNPRISKAPIPTFPSPRFLLPFSRFWHLSVWPKLFILGEALTQNFKKSYTNLGKQTRWWVGGAERVPSPCKGCWGGWAF